MTTAVALETASLNQEESALLGPLLEMLIRGKRIGPRSVVLRELSWGGNRVDLATMSTHGVTAAYELKVGSISRALEQATYNRLAFDRSWVVVPGIPRADNLALAAGLGIGVICVSGSVAKVILRAARQTSASRELRLRLRREIQRRAR